MDVEWRFPRWGSWASSITIAWEWVGNANFRPCTRPSDSETLRPSPTLCVLARSAGDSDAHWRLRITGAEGCGERGGERDQERVEVSLKFKCHGGKDKRQQFCLGAKVRSAWGSWRVTSGERERVGGCRQSLLEQGRTWRRAEQPAEGSWDGPGTKQPVKG